MKLRQEYKRDLMQTLGRLRNGTLRVHIPPEEGLWRPQPNSHFHPAPELFIQTGGATDFKCPGKRFTVKTNEVCVMPRGVPHAEIPRDTDSPYEILLACLYHQNNGISLLRAKADPMRKIKDYGNMLIPNKQSRGSIRYLEYIPRYINIPRAEQRRYVNALIEVFILTILGELSHLEFTPPKSSPLITEVEKLVHAQLSDPELSISGLAKEIGCSADHLSRCFSKERGVSLSTWIQKERVNMARRLLHNMQHNIAEVGWACGFSTPSYFIRVFRGHTGITPMAFRNTPVH